MSLQEIIDDLLRDLKDLRFSDPITHVYNPLEYARESYDRYLAQYANGPKEIVLLGMNPGPWGMAQTGIPFGEVNLVKEWLGIETHVGIPKRAHPKRPVHGFLCQRSEVSGKRLWGWAKERFASPDQFFKRFLVLNYCPLIFMEESGRNRTPNNIKNAELKPLLNACDRALRNTIERLQPLYVLGVGTFAEQRANTALTGIDVTIGRITHPSPANPKANRGWSILVEKEIKELGIGLP
ncbi:MAG: single-stranded DNA-binding protein [Candidatus Scalindua sp. AMX11]|nr:MAG: single-stranded DNA-binding protein [Candidatus Scalindua sp.]NOG82733.1 single-stranded DNA-binding protein [Planctomycetota bacterium]RZV95302.1 MAG: single-stranded DNA-binding protein [Candidatus Scalindua sp. SCAELEC01]TDE66215.1 MAG: single-stranded DNA-binding protein [Candidatus Scalindua sp. AMX11]GJQ57836.1 MAG: single-strand selective monofunctional uracil DNA glycosylase [Candidatus Scalindua sp.]